VRIFTHTEDKNKSSLAFLEINLWLFQKDKTVRKQRSAFPTSGQPEIWRLIQQQNSASSYS